MRRPMDHLGIDELLSVRDGQATASALRHVDECPRCRGELLRLRRVQADLRALPAPRPPRDLWPGLARKVVRRRRWQRAALGGAVLALAAGVAGLVVGGPIPTNGSEDAVDAWTAEAVSDDLGPIIHRSRELESILRVYSPERRVYDARTALAVSVLEDRIFLLDRLLTEGRAVGADRQVLRGLWNERVETLETLVGLQVVSQEPVWR